VSQVLLALLLLAPQHAERKHGNPADLDSYIARLADPARDAWQKPEQVVQELDLAPGQTACDIGSGPGYFTLRLAAAVGETGRVYAVDVEAKILEALRDRIEAAGRRNVTPVLAIGSDPLLSEGLCDLILVVDTYHHFPERPRYLARLARSLRPGGSIVNIDYEKRPTPVGPPLEHRLSKAEFLAEAKQAGLRAVRDVGTLPYQYFLVLQPAGPAPAR